MFQIWQAFASEEKTEDMRQAFRDGIAWGEAKKQLFELINEEIAPARERYNALMEDSASIEDILLEGAKKAREQSQPLLEKVRSAVGVSPL